MEDVDWNNFTIPSEKQIHVSVLLGWARGYPKVEGDEKIIAARLFYLTVALPTVPAGTLLAICRDEYELVVEKGPTTRDDVLRCKRREL